MTAPIVRHLRLPAAQGSPAAARAAVAEAVLAAGLRAILDEALLLATELVTNSVVHVGDDLEVEIVATPDALTVTVLDKERSPLSFTAWPPGPPEGAGNLAERGRGLLLVDQFADSWGTVHHRDGKGIWFRLERQRGSRRPHQAPQPANPGSGPVAAPTAQTIAALGSVYTAANGRTSLTEVGTELLRRLCDVAGAAAATVLVDEGDGTGARAIVGYTRTGPAATDRGPAPGGGRPAELRRALHLSRPWRGELVLLGTDPRYSAPLVELTVERLTLLVENHRLRRTGAARRAWLTFLAEASELLAQSLDVELTLALIPRLVVPRLGTWCAVHTIDAEGDLVLAAATHADEAQLCELRAMLTAEVPQIREALRTESAMPLPAPVDGYAVALVARGRRLGVLSVGPVSGSWPRTEEVAVIEDVAKRAAFAIDNARIHADRREVAEALQRSLLPPNLPSVPGVEFGAEYVPTGEGVDVGGDFYDIIALPAGGWLIMIGDVSGKGVPAAAVTGLVRDVTRVLVRDGRTLPEALTRLNETLADQGGGRFCTLALAAAQQRPGGILELDLHLAGHDRPVLVAADGTTRMVGRCGTALGLLETIRSPVARLTLAPGDTLVFYTDGVTERRRGEELFGHSRLLSAAARLAGYPAAVVAAQLRAVALGFSEEPPRDDLAIVTIRNDSPPD